MGEPGMHTELSGTGSLVYSRLMGEPGMHTELSGTGGPNGNRRTHEAVYQIFAPLRPYGYAPPSVQAKIYNGDGIVCGSRLGCVPSCPNGQENNTDRKAKPPGKQNW